MFGKDTQIVITSNSLLQTYYLHGIFASLSLMYISRMPSCIAKSYGDIALEDVVKISASYKEDFLQFFK
ncbi:hypothetical protein D0T57_07965 [Dysgonomonas sp. 511]|nr:hypothetical protein [Dysgonomonas sp. 511]